MRLIHIAALFVLGGCSALDPKVNTESDSRPSIPWKASMIQGASFNSIPDSGILYLVFPKTGNTVAATIGDRNPPSLAAPLWYWTIDSSGDLVLSDYSGKMEATIKLIEFKNTEVTVRNGKDYIHYKRTQK